MMHDALQLLSHAELLRLLHVVGVLSSCTCAYPSFMYEHSGAK